MSKPEIVYNSCLVIGLLLIFFGMWLQFSLGAALIAAGAVLFGTTISAIRYMTKPPPSE